MALKRRRKRLRLAGGTPAKSLLREQGQRGSEQREKGDTPVDRRVRS